MNIRCSTRRLTTRTACVYRVDNPKGFPRHGGGLVPAHLCRNERGYAPMPTPPHVRGVSASYLNGHYRNLLCSTVVDTGEWTPADEARFENNGGFDPFED